MNIRKANKEDLPSIYNLVKTLANYEKSETEVTATLEDYQNDFQAGVFQAHVAEMEDKIIGMMIYYMTYSTWKGRMLYLEDFMVYEEYRRLGVGQLLWDELCKEAKRQGARLLKWQVLDWNESAIKFYKKIKQLLKRNGIMERLFFNDTTDFLMLFFFFLLLQNLKFS